MRSKQHRKPPHSWFIPLLTFTFFWLVIGELISFHQRAIFQFYVFNQHPFSTTDKTTKVKVYKLKDGKNGKTDTKSALEVTSVITNPVPGLALAISNYAYPEEYIPLFHSESSRLNAARAPPCL